MKQKVSINDRSVESAGIPKDYRQSICELVWNGFDAKATMIDIQFESDEVDHIDSVVVVDNGDGIEYGRLSETFGFLLDSIKRVSYQRSSYNHGKRGKGRFSFATLAARATWHTVFKEGDKFLEYDIVVEKKSKDDYDPKNKCVSKRTSTGTEVRLEGLFDVTAYSFTSKEFIDYLAHEFGWFLFLNKENGFKLSVNGSPLSYEHLIAESEVSNLVIKSEDGASLTFTVTYVRWNERMGEKYYFYYLNSEKREAAKKLTTFNNNAIEFHHSVFVQSSFFDDFVLTGEGAEQELFGPTSSDPSFKALSKHLQEFVSRKQKHFVRSNAADELVAKLEQRGVLPKFGKNKYDAERRRDFVNVVKELYCVEPKIFKSLKKEQEISLLGFLNLVLDSDQRECVLSIMERLVQLTPTERSELALVLQRTSFAHIVETVKLIENRFRVVELLKTLVFDLKRFTTERDNIQKAIEQNYWLFGEQYHLTAADETFETLLSNYLHLVDGLSEKAKIAAYDAKRRPDIFMCRKRNMPDPQDASGQLEENVMVELKRPSVTIGKEQFRQIDDYLEFILKEDRFNSQTRLWRFFVVSNKVDGYIEKQYEAFQDKGKRFLVQQAGRYEIYALTWDDVFRSFEVKHSYLLEKLNFDKEAIRSELLSKGVTLSKDGSQVVTEEIIELSPEPTKADLQKVVRDREAALKKLRPVKKKR